MAPFLGADGLGIYTLGMTLVRFIRSSMVWVCRRPQPGLWRIGTRRQRSGSGCMTFSKEIVLLLFANASLALMVLFPVRGCALHVSPCAELIHYLPFPPLLALEGFQFLRADSRRL